MADRSQIMALRQLLESEDIYPPNDCLFIERGEINLESFCLVDPADLYDVDYIPPLALKHNLQYVIMMDIYLDIMLNLNYQIKNPSIEQRLEALIFYFEHDAFKVWS